MRKQKLSIEIHYLGSRDQPEKISRQQKVISRQLFLMDYVCLHRMISNLVPIVIWYIGEL